MSLQKPSQTVDINGTRFTLRRPGRGGVSRIAVRFAQRVASDPLLAQIDGLGIEMEAVLHEYLVEGPDDWRLRDGSGKPITDGGKPVWTFEDVDANIFGQLGEAAVAFHRSFRAADARFGVPVGEFVGGTGSLARPHDAPESGANAS